MLKVSRMLGSLVAMGVVMGILVPGAQKQALAQKDYLDIFTDKYEKVKDQAKEKKCTVCHGSASKKERSAYAKELGKALGATKVKDKDKIKKAFEEIEKKESGSDKKTYGDLLKDGKLPPAYDKEKDK